MKKPNFLISFIIFCLIIFLPFVVYTGDTTTYYGWTIPDEYSDPWYQVFVNLMNQIDGRVYQNDADDVEDGDFAVNGLMTRTAADTYTSRTITGDTEIVVANGNGVADNPSLAIGAAITRDTEHDTWAEHPALTENYILQGNASNQPTPTNTLSVDIVNLAAGSKYQVGGAQIDHNDMAGISTNYTTGLLAGGVVTNTKAAAYTIGTDNIYESYGGVIYVTGAAVITLPAVQTGMAVTVITIGAVAVSLNPNDNDRMYLDGVLLDDGDQATNTSTTGDSIVATYYSADGWYCMSGSPDGDNWTDGS